jgi:hypothetical protein
MLRGYRDSSFSHEKTRTLTARPPLMITLPYTHEIRLLESLPYSRGAIVPLTFGLHDPADGLTVQPLARERQVLGPEPRGPQLRILGKPLPR